MECGFEYVGPSRTERGARIRILGFRVRRPMPALIHQCVLIATLSFLPLLDSFAAETVDQIFIEKAERRMTLLSGDEALHTFSISLGGAPVGHKVQEGDQKTPEGDYSIDLKNPTSSFYRSIRISYPNDEDKAHAESLGVEPGGLIMIHGMKNGFGWLGALHLWLDWTDGCVAVTDDEMDVVWETVDVGTPVRIKP